MATNPVSSAETTHNDGEEFKTKQNITGLNEWKAHVLKNKPIDWIRSTNNVPSRGVDEGKLVWIEPKEAPVNIVVVRNIVKMQSYIYGEPSSTKKPNENAQPASDSDDDVICVSDFTQEQFARIHPMTE